MPPARASRRRGGHRLDEFAEFGLAVHEFDAAADQRLHRLGPSTLGDADEFLKDDGHADGRNEGR